MRPAHHLILAICPLLHGADLSESNRSAFSAAYSEGRLSPSFQNGRLVSVVPETAVSTDANVFVYSKSGALAGSYALAPPDAIRVRLWDASIGSSGTVAGVGQAIDREGRLATFLAIVPSGRKVASIRRLNPFTGERVAVASDGTIWLTASRTDDDGGDEASRGDYDVVRHFSTEGVLMDSLVPRSSLQGIQPASGSGGTNMTWIRSNGRRIGVYLGSSHRWLDLMGGRVTECTFTEPLRRGEPPISLASVALPETGGPVALFEHASGLGLFQLRCDSKSWEPLSLHLPTDATAVTDLVGADGSHFVFRGPQAPPTTLIWASIPARPENTR